MSSDCLPNWLHWSLIEFDPHKVSNFVSPIRVLTNMSIFILWPVTISTISEGIQPFRLQIYAYFNSTLMTHVRWFFHNSLIKCQWWCIKRNAPVTMLAKWLCSVSVSNAWITIFCSQIVCDGHLNNWGMEIGALFRHNWEMRGWSNQWAVKHLLTCLSTWQEVASSAQVLSYLDRASICWLSALMFRLM